MQPHTSTGAAHAYRKRRLPEPKIPHLQQALLGRRQRLCQRRFGSTEVVRENLVRAAVVIYNRGKQNGADRERI